MEGLQRLSVLKWSRLREKKKFFSLSGADLEKNFFFSKWGGLREIFFSLSPFSSQKTLHARGLLGGGFPFN